MAQTPLGTATPYCMAAQLFAYHDWQQVADLLRDGEAPRPSRLSILDDTSDPGTMLATFLLTASGEIESACLVGKRYVPDDLAALTNSGAARLRKLCADLAFYLLTERRQPASADPQRVPGAWKALQTLDQLEKGERVFGLLETAEAGLPSVAEAKPEKRLEQDVTESAVRIFGTHARGTLTNRRRCW